MAADELLFGPLHVLGFFTFMTKAEGGSWQVSTSCQWQQTSCRRFAQQDTESSYTLQDVRQKIKHDFLSTYLAELAIWPAFQAFNFWKVPVRHQLLVVNTGCLLDATFLCW